MGGLIMSVILNATTTTGLAMTPDNSGAIQFQSNGTNTIAITTSGAINASTQSLQTGGTTALYIDGSQNVGIGTTPYATGMVLYRNTTGLLYNDIQNPSSANASDGAITRLITQNVASSGTVSVDMVKYKSGQFSINNNETNAAAFTSFAVGASERMRIDSSGNLLVGTTSQQSTAILSVVGGASKNGIAIPVANGQTGIIVSNTGAYNYSAQTFFYNSSQVGAISISSTSTAYNTSSDYRLKTNVTPLTTAQSGPIIDALKPSQFTWKEDNSSDVGFIAHEIQAVIPRAVTGEKDAVDAEGKPVYQQVAVSSPEIIAYLVAELQSVRQRLAGLESTVSTQATEIAALKSKVGA